MRETQKYITITMHHPILPNREKQSKPTGENHNQEEDDRQL